MRAISTIAVLLLAPACDCGGKQAVLAGDDVVLAEVNGSTISRYDVEQAVASTLGSYGSSRLNDDDKKKVLQSLVQSRAIAQAEDKALAPAARAALDRKVAAYREELLVKQYLAKHTGADEVTPQMIERYYHQHPDRFGGKLARSYELISSTAELAGSERAALMQALAKAEVAPDWQQLTAELERAGHPITLVRGSADDQVLHPSLRKLMAQLPVGKSSKLTFIEGRLYLARITGESKLPARPLAEVSAEIRRTLAPVSLRNGVKQAAERVLKDSEVAYR
jgi:hypothetical protein